MSWILPILSRLVFNEMPNSCIFKKPRIWQFFWYMTWYGEHIRKKYRWRQVLWADALIQMPRKTGVRNLMDKSRSCHWWQWALLSTRMQWRLRWLMKLPRLSICYIQIKVVKYQTTKTAPGSDLASLTDTVASLYTKQKVKHSVRKGIKNNAMLLWH